MIDWTFISAREGGQILRGYVPSAGQFGVTIAADSSVKLADIYAWLKTARFKDAKDA